MASGFAKPITIKEAIDKIVAREYLLPAIQRKFVWSSYQIEVLFDSIMRGYPINSFMFWEINTNELKNTFKFYQFLTEYRQFFKEDNIDIDTKGNKDFYAIIDGQQRLTSLYIGLKGSYAYKMPRKWWRDDEECLPTRKLYLNLKSPVRDCESSMKYDFKFLTDEESKYEDEYTKWYQVNEILRWNDRTEFRKYLKSDPLLSSNDFAYDTIYTLRDRIFEDELINYYLEDKQDIDQVLEIFIRTNSGGEPLSFSNLLMSYTTANWTVRDARKSFSDLIKQVYSIGKPNFIINADLILKICLVLFKDNIKFQVKNFDHPSVAKIEQNWDDISKAIVEAFKLIESWGFNDSNFRAKNAIIPIVYFIYHNNLKDVINNKAKFNEVKSIIRQWLCLSLLKGVFGGQPDNVLNKIRKVLEKHKGDCVFPLDEIKDTFKEDAVKNLSFSEEFIDGLLTTQKDQANCYTILALIYTHLNFNQEFHKDHLHPFSFFDKLEQGTMSDEEYAFYKNPLNYNSILNLQLLNSSLNESKLDTPLIQWVKEKNIDLDTQLIPKNVSLDITNFKDFITERRKMLKQRLLSIVGKDTTIQQ